MKYIVILLVITSPIFASCSKQKPSPEQIQTEMDSLYSLRKGYYEKYIPDSVKERANTASHDIAFTDYDSPSYWEAKGVLNQVSEYVKKNCGPCNDINEVIDIKEIEYGLREEIKN